MAGIGKTLYPPIMPTYQTAFVYTDPCKVYFSLSSYNDLDDSLAAEVAVSYRDSNSSALSKFEMVNGQKVVEKKIQIDDTIKNDNKYYVEINPTEITNINSEDKIGFAPDGIYKIQVRFKSEKDGVVMRSEWSSATLIKGIFEPVLKMDRLDPSVFKLYVTELNTYVGRLEFIIPEDIDPKDNSETLKTYRIRVLTESGAVYEDSGWINSLNNSNTIIYDSDKIFDEQHSLSPKYSVIVDYVTSSGYSASQRFDNIYIATSDIKNDAEAISATADNSKGVIIVNVNFSNATGHYVIKRASSKTNYMVWEDIHYFDAVDAINHPWEDHTAESGVGYQYGVLKDYGDYRSVIKASNIVKVDLEDMFLSGGGRHFKVEFNPGISSFKKNVLDAKTDPMGSTFPFIRRNGQVGYRTFPITGLISVVSDIEDKNYNPGYKFDGMDRSRDNLLERKFREDMMDFLYKDNFKLFRSETEGNLIVRLMDVSFTPNQQLGRMIYSFSATAHEVAYCTIDNYDKYDIQKIGSHGEVSGKDNLVGQLNYNGLGDVNIYQMIKDKHEYRAAQGSEKIAVQKITGLSIAFDSAPYLIAFDENNQPVPANGQDGILAGYIVYVKDSLAEDAKEKAIIIKTNRKYELLDAETEIVSIRLPETIAIQEVTFDYAVNILTSESSDDVPKNKFIDAKIGQIHGSFEPDTSFRATLIKRYDQNGNELSSWNYAGIEAPVGTLFDINDKDNEVEIDDTGYLNISSNFNIIKDIILKGRRFVEKVIKTDTGDYYNIEIFDNDIFNMNGAEITLNNKLGIEDKLVSISLANELFVAKDNEYIDLRAVLGDYKFIDENAIINPIKNAVYPFKDNVDKIYTNSQWCVFKDGVAKPKLGLIIDYICEVTKEV